MVSSLLQDLNETESEKSSHSDQEDDELFQDAELDLEEDIHLALNNKKRDSAENLSNVNQTSSNIIKYTTK